MSGDLTNLSADKQTLVALRALRQRLEEIEGQAREPIAIVGMACRFPGGADTPASYWDLLEHQRDAVSEIPNQRMDLNPVFDDHPQTPGKTYSRWAGLLNAPGDFDAEFFGISPREAVTMDPQQRLLLEVSWEALENAAINPKSLGGQPAGVFVGITTSEYSQLLQRIIPREQFAAHVLQGSALNATAGRLSYFYGLNGPSMAIDTACSSSLVAIDRACRSLREGESQFAIAAGVNILANPESLIIISQWGMLSPSGKVRAFDLLADGFVRGEGCGVLVLKRLRDAELSGDRVLGVILGSAVNQDGASSGLTVPNGLAQQSLLREAHRRSGIEAWQVGYVEAHGTGTSLGDPIEAEALGAVFSEGRARAKKLLLGSVKTNVGHLESAAGVAGLIKVVLGLQHGVVPGQLHWRRPSEHVRWSELPLEVVTESRPWDPIGGRRIGGVSSFGFSGTNAHVVIEGRQQEAAVVDQQDREEVLVITARTQPALRELAGRYAEFLLTSESAWSEISFTSAVGRAVFGERLAIVASARQEASLKLRNWLRSGQEPGVHRGQVGAGHRATGVALGLEAGAEAVAAHFVSGGAIDWKSRSGERKLHRVDLPTYAFQRERYWVEPVEAARRNIDSGTATRRGMLGSRLRAAGVRGQYETHLRGEGWIGEHVVEGRVVLPATGHLELMLEAGAEALGSRCVVEDVVLQSPLVIDGERRVQTVVEQESANRSRVRVYAEQAEGEWECVSEGWLRREATGSDPEELNLSALQQRLEARAAGDEFYAEMKARGLNFGERFRGVQQVWTGTGEALGKIGLAETGEAGWELEPWWLDACLQVAGLAASASEDDALYLPLSVEHLQIHGRATGQSWSHVQLQRIDTETLSANINITNNQGKPLANINNLRFRKINRKKTRTAVYGIDWTATPLQAMPTPLIGHWAVLSGAGNLGEEICKEIQKRGATCSFISCTDPDKVTNTGTYNLHGGELDETRRVLRRIVADRGLFERILDLRPVDAMKLSELEGSNTFPALPVLHASLSLLQALLLEQIVPTQGVWTITSGAQSDAGVAISAEGHAIQSMQKTAMLEFPELRIHSLDISAETGIDVILRACSMVDTKEMILRREQILVPRLAERIGGVSEENSELIPANDGMIESLRTVSVERKAPQEEEVEIAIHAQGVNFRDVMNSLGMLAAGVQKLGGECAGIVVRSGSLSGFKPGERVFAFAPGSFKKFVTVTATNVARIPQRLTFAQAAALPVVYLTAFYGLDRLASLQPGESILIHSAAGGLGLAAVHVAQARGAVIYATAGSEEKRNYLRSQGIQHVLPSRTIDFADEVMRLTNGRGVDVVLNSLTGALAEKTLSILAEGGRFLEVGKRDTLSGEKARQIRPDVRHFVYDLGEEAARDSVLVPSLLREMLTMLAEGTIEPLPVTEFADAKEAFRYMAQARHVGKIVITPSDASNKTGLLNPDPNATYLITGGRGGLGLFFAGALVERGARHLILVGRSAPDATVANEVERLRLTGTDITLVNADIADRHAVELILQKISPSKPLKGILHAAGVLDDHSLLEQSSGTLAAVMQPKWAGAWNLHTLTRNINLDFFVLFSSAGALLGSRGQANYVAANAMLDALAVYRRGLRLPAISVQWGPWNSAGMTEKVKVDSQDIGLGRIDPVDGLEALDKLIGTDETVAAVLPILSWHRFSSRRLHTIEASVETNAHTSENNLQERKKRNSFSEELLGVPATERRTLLNEHLRQQALHILSLSAQTRIDEDEALHDLGLDSLMAVELRNALSVSLDRQLPPTMVLDYPTLRTLTSFLLTEMFEGRETSAEEGLPDDLAAMSEEEAELLLLEELGRRDHGARR